MPHTVRPLSRGSNPFPFDSPLIDAISRLGLPVTQIAELESFWWFMMPDGCVSPDDLASAIMRVLPPETDEEAARRRSMISMGLEHRVTLHERVQVRPKKGTGKK